MRASFLMYQIRTVRSTDRESWQMLWDGYLRFYRHHLDPAVTDATFARLLDERVQPYGLVAESDGKLLGFANYLFHPTTWSLRDLCYLEDLYVDSGARGGGVGRRLIEAVYEIADQTKAAGVYWNTQEFNAEARALYDTLAHRTSFIRYER
jgi:GNAT superfamily N-acetyltransferase